MIKISPYKSFYKAALTISFDYETSAPTYTPRSWKTIYRYYLEQTNRFRKKKKRTNYGNSQREGAELIFTALQEFKLHATWFGIGHTLLKGNKSKNEYRINQTLPSSPHADPWREKIRTFDDEPFSTYKKRSDYYFGDLTEKLRDHGEDIQCHTFSHPVLALEPLENIEMDLEDWQNAASRNGYARARILAFPFLADCCYFHPDINKRAAYKIPGEKWEIEPISAERLRTINQSGIELITRCGSKQNDSPFKSFRKYNESSLFYVTSRSMDLGIFNREDFEKKVQEIIHNEWLVDFWCHPHNVAEYPLQNFHDFLDVISAYNNTKELWIPTLTEAWDHFNKVRNIELTEEHTDGGDLGVLVMNHNETDVSEVGIDADLEKFVIKRKEGIQTDLNDSKRIVVSSIPAKSTFNFILHNSNGRPVN
jgi:hypothetical protein